MSRFRSTFSLRAFSLRFPGFGFRFLYREQTTNLRTPQGGFAPAVKMIQATVEKMESRLEYVCQFRSTRVFKVFCADDLTEFVNLPAGR